MPVNLDLSFNLRGSCFFSTSSIKGMFFYDFLFAS